MKIYVCVLLERFALWLLWKLNTQIITISTVIHPYWDEIIELCRKENEGPPYHTDDILGAGYFKFRRVMSIMLRNHPELRKFKPALAKAVCVCSDSLDSGNGQIQQRPRSVAAIAGSQSS